MIKKPHIEKDATLRQILKRYDPVTPPTRVSLAALEANILMQVNGFTKRSRLMNDPFPLWIFPQGWNLQAAALIVMLIVTSGFMVGHVLDNGLQGATFTRVPMLMALANQNQDSPSAAILWGDSDDDQ